MCDKASKQDFATTLPVATKNYLKHIVSGILKKSLATMLKLRDDPHTYTG